MKRVIISGGGTGGHIYPAITIYKEIMKQNPDAKVLYVGTKQGLEATLVPKEGIEFTTIPVQGLQRQLSLGTLVTLGKTALGIVKANAIVVSLNLMWLLVLVVMYVGLFSWLQHYIIFLL